MFAMFEEEVRLKALQREKAALASMREAIPETWSLLEYEISRLEALCDPALIGASAAGLEEIEPALNLVSLNGAIDSVSGIAAPGRATSEFSPSPPYARSPTAGSFFPSRRRSSQLEQFANDGAATSASATSPIATRGTTGGPLDNSTNTNAVPFVPQLRSPTFASSVERDTSPGSMLQGLGPRSKTMPGPLVKKRVKLPVPADKYPDYNFVGRLLGPRGATLKALERDTGCKIMIRGKGSIRKDKEMEVRGKPGWEHVFNEPLHVVVEAENEEAVATRALNRAKEAVELLLVPVPEDRDSLKRQQLRDLAILNGTFRGQQTPGGGVVGGALGAPGSQQQISYGAGPFSPQQMGGTTAEDMGTAPVLSFSLQLPHGSPQSGSGSGFDSEYDYLKNLRSEIPGNVPLGVRAAPQSSPTRPPAQFANALQSRLPMSPSNANMDYWTPVPRAHSTRHVNLEDEEFNSVMGIRSQSSADFGEVPLLGSTGKVRSTRYSGPLNLHSQLYNGAFSNATSPEAQQGAGSGFQQN
ncbi:Protein quaking-A [Porphyridium purpureum]|uniref:Protein quaking-A n=1 Tax=Porphyridium purpureum TaxID=35688 RepID=A0A5J4Z4E7_PORPP|nr:Protein quaking-A [Porphyridium purpureum]|eukprot:POR7661..scf295_1